jgi:vacuolar-type H+-ATPase subunit H
MLEVITDIIEAEEKARKIVSEAQEQASRLKSEVEAEERRTLAEAREKAAEIYRRNVAEAQEQADARYQQALRRNRSRGREFEEEHRERIDRVVDRIVGLLSRPAYAD